MFLTCSMEIIENNQQLLGISFVRYTLLSVLTV